MIRRRLLLGVAAGLALAGFGGGAFAQQPAAKPLKITVYGGSGNIGSRIVAEALARGHQVTVVDRDPKPSAGPANAKLKVVKGDVFDSADIAKNIAGQDALVTAVAVRPTPTRDFYVRLAKGVVAAQRAQSGTKTRFLMVGGAGSLEVEPGKRLVDSLPATMPDAAKNELLSMAESLDYLRTVSDVPWTFFSPAGQIVPGTRTAKFRIGGDQLLKDAQGVSRISMEDYAVAMLDEIEKPQHVNKRFTVAY